MDLVAVIPARGGSKRLPGKNIRPLGGLPLIAWTIRAAIEASIFDEIVVTTDDSGISACAQDAGARVIDRPAVLASDTACSADVVRHAIDLLKLPDAASFMLMQPTSPFRTAEHMREALALRGHGCSSVMGIVAGKPLGWALNMDSDGMLHPALSAQAVLHDDSPPTARTERFTCRTAGCSDNTPNFTTRRRGDMSCVSPTASISTSWMSSNWPRPS
ncbi:acylneuraminate cytidylyltransferase family protein [Roseovarius pelagicus]|uniref:Acylneuraminate cytidylyltransferase family protein n=1 Tax=Roseovarius pelagicus TaxID=2980108 RepID=A0ABY6D707_9RHOB|nr:acylneuraminate cytidylyltransferase family protein [Roseovarius pelagicus]UXX81405.1 acylneuraminate cytidylyltransferase family protein [Roseovarius pelagicus]